MADLSLPNAFRRLDWRAAGLEGAATGYLVQWEEKARAGAQDAGPAGAAQGSGDSAVVWWGSSQLVMKLRVVDLFERTVRLQSLVRGDQRGQTMATGSIKKVVADRGFGFIVADDAKEYFFHRDGLDSSLNFDRLLGGEKVNFEIEASPKGPRASKVSAA